MKIIVFTNDSLTGKFIERKICDLTNIDMVVVDKGIRVYTNKILKKLLNSLILYKLLLSTVYSYILVKL